MLRRAAVLGIALWLPACTERVILNDLGDGGGPDFAASKDAMFFTPGDVPCGTVSLHVDYVPRAAQLVVLLDRSNSMQSSFAGTTRQDAAESALVNVVATYQSRVKFGFEQFPPDGSDRAFTDCPRNTCCAGSVGVDPQPNAYKRMSGAINCGEGQNLACPAPTYDSASYAALAQVRDYFKSKNSFTDDDRYVLLVTASEPSCSAQSNSDDACKDALSAASDLGGLGALVVVVSVGYQPTPDSCLYRISQTGSSLLPPANTSTLYAPSNLYGLNTALTEFVSAVAETGCTLDSYDPPPPAEAELKIYIGNNQNPIPQDGQNGWSYANPDRTSITLSGAACDQFVMAQTNQISASYSCSTCGGSKACP